MGTPLPLLECSYKPGLGIRSCAPNSPIPRNCLGCCFLSLGASDADGTHRSDLCACILVMLMKTWVSVAIYIKKEACTLTPRPAQNSTFSVSRKRADC